MKVRLLFPWMMKKVGEIVDFKERFAKYLIVTGRAEKVVKDEEQVGNLEIKIVDAPVIDKMVRISLGRKSHG